MQSNQSTMMRFGKPLFERILITNDDGISAPGIKVLVESVQQLAKEVWVVAPETENSGQSQSVTLHHPLRCKQYEERMYSISGTPSDCVIFALHHMLKDTPPDLVISGINRGANVSDSVPFSGTLGACTTATTFGIPAIGLSQSFRNASNIKWQTASHYMTQVISQLAPMLQEHFCFNVNFPDIEPEQVTGWALTKQSVGSITSVNVEKKRDPRNNDYFWFSFNHDYPSLQDDSFDVSALRKGKISVSCVSVSRAAAQDIEINLPEFTFSELAL